MIFLEPCATRHPATGVANNCYLIPDMPSQLSQLSESEKTGRNEDRMIMNKDGRNTLNTLNTVNTVNTLQRKNQYST